MGPAYYYYCAAVFNGNGTRSSRKPISLPKQAAVCDGTRPVVCQSLAIMQPGIDLSYGVLSPQGFGLLFT